MNKLIKRTRLAGKVLRFVPFLRLAALNGSIVRGEETKESDIDILIIAKSGRLYTARFFATLVIALTGYRRHGSHVAGRICLNCYLNDKNPSILPKQKKDLQKVAKAYKYMITLVDDGASKKFFRLNKWFEEHEVSGETHSQLLKSHCFKEFPLRGSVPCSVSLRAYWCGNLWRMPVALFEKLLSGKFGDYFEQRLMSYQIKRILSGKQSASRRSDQIYADQFAIKLHPKKR